MEKTRVNSTEEQLLRQLNDDRIRAYVPAITFSAIVVVFGILGNAISVAFYGFKVPRTSNNILITLLATVDLITCIVISDKIIELFFIVTFKSIWGCKAIYFCNHTLVSVSGFTLLLVTVDRYRKICRPFAWQISILTLKLSFASIVVFSILFSVRDLVLLDVVRVNVTYAGRNIRAYYCTHSRAESIADTVTAFQCINLIILSIVVVAIAVLYSCIAKKIWKSRKKLIQHYKQSGIINELDASESEATNSGDINTDTESNMTLNEGQIPTCDTSNTGNVVNADDKTFQNGSSSQRDQGNDAGKINFAQEHIFPDKNNGNKKLEGPVFKSADLGNHEQDVSDTNEEKRHTIVMHRKDEKDIDRGSGFYPNQDLRRLTQRRSESQNIERTVTLMMFTVNVAFLVSYIPYFIVNLWIKQQSNSSAQEFNAGIQIALRSYMLNNAINPYIFGFFNSNFRKFVKSLFCDLRIFSRR